MKFSITHGYIKLAMQVLWSSEMNKTVGQYEIQYHHIAHSLHFILSVDVVAYLLAMSILSEKSTVIGLILCVSCL